MASRGRRVPTEPHKVFDLRSSQLAVGDPVMGLAIYDVQLPAGRYYLRKGSLDEWLPECKPPVPLISLDSPCIFALDALLLEPLDEWFHEIISTQHKSLFDVEDRLEDFERQVGQQIAFYWEQDLCGEAREGEYILDLNKVYSAK